MSGHMRILLSRAGMGRIAHLSAFLPEMEKAVMPWTGLWSVALSGTKFDAVAGWGHKGTSRRARAIAQRRDLPYLAVEDGFLRSYALGVDGAAPMSLVLDRTGIYYNAAQPSDLERMLEYGTFDETLLRRAATAIDWIRTEKLCKYNKQLVSYDGAPIKCLIVDQTAGDASVLMSGAPEDAFERMIEDAIACHGAPHIAIKLHPDTMAGKKGGYLKGLSEKHGVRLLDKPYNPWDLLAQVEEVYTISSLLGFEALMAGKTVHCYGMPFYAGWGATQDKLVCARRTAQRSVAEIFAAAYIQYARYVNPYTGEATDIEDIIGILSDLVRHEKIRTALSGKRAVGFSPWKRHFIPNFTGAPLRFCEDVPADRNDGERLLVWGLKQEDLPPPLTRVEDGFVRSRGLGARLVRPWSLVFDERGIYFDPRCPSDLEEILQTARMPEGLLARADRVRALMVDRDISKYNTGAHSTLPDIPRNKRVILVPGQVEDDASIRAGTVEGLSTNLDVLRAAREAAPDAHILYKPHPDVEAGKRKGAVSSDVSALYCDGIVRDTAISALWHIVDEVHTLTSLSGFEGLLRGKAVHVYGRPFYAGWGLTHDRQAFERRARRLTLRELIAGALILYPVYFDWKTRRICNIETVIHRLSVKTV